MVQVEVPVLLLVRVRDAVVARRVLDDLDAQDAVSRPCLLDVLQTVDRTPREHHVDVDEHEQHHQGLWEQTAISVANKRHK